MQFLLCIGQEVLVQFLEDDIDWLVILGVFYNGQGEGFVVFMFGGEVVQGGEQECNKVFISVSDFFFSGQGNLVGGNVLIWYGGSQDGEGYCNVVV